MAEVKRVNFGDILQAIEDKLLADGVVADRAQITWALNQDVPQLAGDKDVLLRARNARNVGHDGGTWDLRTSRYVDIFIRSQSIAEPGGGNKEWIKEQFALADNVLSSLSGDLNDHPEGFWPTDANGNLLTTEALRLAGDVAPERQRDASAWGDSVCTFEVKYMPKVDLKKA